MLNFFRRKEKYRILRPVNKESKFILDEERFAVQEEEKSTDAKAAETNLVNYLRKPDAKRSISCMICTLFCMALTYAAYRMNLMLLGSPNQTLAALAVSSFLFSFLGIIFGILSFFEREVKYRLSYIGLFICGSTFVLWIVIMIRGYTI